MKPSSGLIAPTAIMSTSAISRAFRTTFGSFGARPSSRSRSAPSTTRWIRRPPCGAIIGFLVSFRFVRGLRGGSQVSEVLQLLLHRLEVGGGEVLVGLDRVGRLLGGRGTLALGLAEQVAQHEDDEVGGRREARLLDHQLHLAVERARD